MEKDLESQADSLLTRLLSEHLVSPAGKQTLMRWFVDRLETERRGWKGRLHDALKATDGEHKLVVASQSIIQRVSQRIEDGLAQHGKVIADSANNDDNVDNRMDRLQVLERNWEAASSYIDKLARERIDCLQVLGVSDTSSNVDVVVELRAHMEAAGIVPTSSSLTQQSQVSSAADMKNTDAERKYEETIAELKKNNASLKAKLKSIHKSSVDAKQRHAKDVAQLRKIVAELEQQQRAREKQITEVYRPGQSDSGGESGVVLPPVSGASSQSRPSGPTPQKASKEDHVISSSSPSASQPPPSPVVMPPLVLPKSSPMSTSRTAAPTTAVVLPHIASDTSSNQQDNMELTTTSLHNQVLGFASRLSEARREVADCQRALIRLQQAAVTATAQPQSTDRGHHQKPSDMDDNRTPRRRQRLQLAAKSVTTIRLPPGELLTSRSRASESTYRMKDDDHQSIASVAAAAAGISSYNMYARQQKTPRRYWRS